MAFRIFRQVRKKSRLIKEQSLKQLFITERILQKSFKSTAVLDEVTNKNGSAVGVGSETESTNGHPDIDLTFSNCQEAYRSKTNLQLIRALFVFKLCSWTYLVDNNKLVSFVKLENL